MQYQLLLTYLEKYKQWFGQHWFTAWSFTSVILSCNKFNGDSQIVVLQIVKKFERKKGLRLMCVCGYSFQINIDVCHELVLAPTLFLLHTNDLLPTMSIFDLYNFRRTVFTWHIIILWITVWRISSYEWFSRGKASHCICSANLVSSSRVFVTLFSFANFFLLYYLS